MGRGKAERPKFLAKKLREARQSLNMTQPQMFEALKAQGMILHAGYISLYETGERLPSLLVLLGYSKICKIPMEFFVDDELTLIH